MAEVINLGIKGLARDSNPLADAQAGGMRICHNLMLRAPNQAEMRPGFANSLNTYTLWTSPFTPDPSYPIWLAKFEAASSAFFYVCSTDGAAWDIRGSDNTQILAPDGTTPAPFDADLAYYKHFEARKSLYFTSNYGLLKSQTTTQIEFDIPIQPPHLPTTMALRTVATGATSVPILTGMAVSYKAVIRRKDTNGYIIRSAPSTGLVVENTTGAACAWAFYSTTIVMARVELNNTHRAGDTLEIYRTKMVANGTSPGDEHFFAFEYTITAADIAAGYVIGETSGGGYLNDYVAELSLGASLYTNATQGEALGANYPPPAAADVAIFQGCAWYANVKFPQAITMQLVDDRWNVYNDTLPAPGFGVGVTTITVNFDANANFPRVGQVIESVGIPANTEVFSVNPGAGTIVITQATTAPGVIGAAVVYRDVWEVEGFVMVAQAGTAGTPTFQQISASRYYLSVNQPFPSQGFYYGSAVLEPSTARIVRAAASAINISQGAGRDLFAYPLIDVETQSATLIVTRSQPSFSNFPVTATSPRSFIPNIGESYTESTQDTVPNGLYYSKQDQPEAVPIKNFLIIGGAHKGIKRIMPTGTALIVFKEDGIYRVTGSPPDGWRVDLINPTAHLGYAECVTELDGYVYAWTDDGIVKVDPGGTVTNVSEGRISDITLAASTFTQLAESRMGKWASAHQGLNCVMFMLNLPSTTTNEVAWDMFGYYSPTGESQTQRQWCYVYWPATDTWTSWEWRGDPVYSAMMADTSPGDGSFYIGKVDELQAQRGGLRDGRYAYDNAYSGLAITTATPGAVGEVELAFTSLSPWIPQLGDNVLIDGVYYRVLRVVGNDVTVYDPDRAIVAPDANVLAVEGIPVIAEWMPFVPGVPTLSGRWREFQYHLGYLSSFDFTTYHAGVGVSTGEWLITDAIESNEAYNLVNASRNHSLRYMVSRNAQRASRIYPVLYLRNSLIFFTLNGISLIYEDVSERQARGSSTANGGIL